MGRKPKEGPRSPRHMNHGSISVHPDTHAKLQHAANTLGIPMIQLTELVLADVGKGD